MLTDTKASRVNTRYNDSRFYANLLLLGFAFRFYLSLICVPPDMERPISVVYNLYMM